MMTTKSRKSRKFVTIWFMPRSHKMDTDQASTIWFPGKATPKKELFRNLL